MSNPGFSWNGRDFDPFKAKVNPRALERAVWCLEQDKKDSDVRQNQIESILERVSLVDNQLISMTFNRRYSEMFRNWAASASEHGINVRDRCVVFPMDDESAEIAKSEGFYFCYNPASEILKSTGEAKVYGDLEFARHMFFQNAVIRDLLAFRVNLLFQDVDLVWLKDPLPLLLSNPESVQFMFDGHNWRHAPLHANTGFMYFRNEPEVLKFWDIIYDRADQVFAHRSQQQPLNIVIGLCKQHGFDVRILAEEDFANGHLMNPDVSKSRRPSDPYVIHCSWTGLLEEKYKKYKNHKIWYLKDNPSITPHAS